MIESPHDRTMRAHGENYAAKKNAKGLREGLEELVGCIGGILGFVVIAVLALGGLWLLVALIKFMWEHS